MRDLFTSIKPAALPPPKPNPSPSLVAVPALLIDGHEVQRCAVCRETASFGFGRDMRRRQPGVWFCGPHREHGR